MLRSHRNIRHKVICVLFGHREVKESCVLFGHREVKESSGNGYVIRCTVCDMWLESELSQSEERLLPDGTWSEPRLFTEVRKRDGSYERHYADGILEIWKPGNHSQVPDLRK